MMCFDNIIRPLWIILDYQPYNYTLCLEILYKHTLSRNNVLKEFQIKLTIDSLGRDNHYNQIKTPS